MNVSGIRRNIKNIAHNYTDAQVKVREATSNDPWGPPSSLMSEISDLTYNVVAFSEIMQMIWKRLNDHGKNYRHVYKALVLLDYLVKTGNEKVAQQCKENIFAIHTLRDFQYYEDGKDHGINVREKSKQLEALLKDDERLKNERIKALKARERFAQQTTGFGTGTDVNELVSPASPTRWDYVGSPTETYGSDPNFHPSRQRAAMAPNDLDLARPQTAGEEELQLQLALAMSREEAEKEEEKRRSDEVRLALAISQSQQDSGKDKKPEAQQSHLLDLLDVSVDPPGAAGGWVDPWGTPAHPADPPAPVMPPRPKVKSDFLQGASTVGTTSTTDAWGMPVASNSPVQVDAWGSPVGQPVAKASNASALGQLVNDPWAPNSSKPPSGSASGSDPWNPQPPPRTVASVNDPWAPISAQNTGGSGIGVADVDDFDLLTTNRAQGVGSSAPGAPRSGSGASSPFDLTNMENALAGSSGGASGGAKPKKSPESFLGPNSNLVNLENLVPSKPNPTQAANPFALGSAAQQNPFQSQSAPRPSINELRHQQNFGSVGPTATPAQPILAQPTMMMPGGVLQPAPIVTQAAPGPWGPSGATAMMPSGSGVQSPTFNPFLA